MDNRILVTGATGFIGSAIFRRLKADGYVVDGLSLHGGEIDGETIGNVDLTSEESLVSYTEGKSYKAIFHIAASIPKSFNLSVSEDCFYPNILSVKNILKLAMRQKNCHLLYASSTSVYKKNQELPLNESSACTPDNYYALSKYIGELMCQLYTGNFPITIFRISSPYGPGYKRQTVINIFCRNAIRSEDLKLFGSGKRSQDFIYIDDIVDAFVLAFEGCRAGVFNICSGVDISMYDLAELVISLVPFSKSKIVFLEQPDPQEDFRGVYSLDNASKVLGFLPKITLKEGLKKTISWWRTQI